MTFARQLLDWSKQNPLIIFRLSMSLAITFTLAVSVTNNTYIRSQQPDTLVLYINANPVSERIVAPLWPGKMIEIPTSAAADTSRAPTGRVYRRGRQP